jgi:hypothetical protein
VASAGGFFRVERSKNMPEMRASFMAWGPAFKKGLTIDGFENVNIYPIVAHILGLAYDAKTIDGKFEVLKPILK